MHEMWTIVIDFCGVCLSISLSVTWSTQLHMQCVWGHLVQPLPNHFGILLVNGSHPTYAVVHCVWCYWFASLRHLMLLDLLAVLGTRTCTRESSTCTRTHWWCTRSFSHDMTIFYEVNRTCKLFISGHQFGDADVWAMACRAFHSLLDTVMPCFLFPH